MADERTRIRRVILIALTEIVIIAISAAIGLLIAHGPRWLHFLAAGH